MDIRLIVDVKTQAVEVGHLHRKGQWVFFYGVLAADAYSFNPQQWLTPQRLREMGPWRRKAESSIGKEIARELGRLRSNGLGDLIDHSQGSTKHWRLTIPTEAITIIPSAQA